MTWILLEAKTKGIEMRIRKNALKKIAKLVNKIETANLYNLYHNFIPQDITDRTNKDSFEDIIKEDLDLYRSASLTVNRETKKAVLHINSNCWIEFKLKDTVGL